MPVTEATTDARAEALFAENPEWRARDGDNTLHWIRGAAAWRWVDVPGDVNGAFILDADRNAHLLAALLPRAIDRWMYLYHQLSACDYLYIAKVPCPQTLSEALDILEGA